MRNGELERKLGGVDLVLVTYNREDTIGRALDSSAEIRFTSVICVDHYSSDRTVDIVREHYPEAEILFEDKGLGYARTLAIGRVRSPFFFFQDSDVVLTKDFLESVSKYLGKSVGAVQGKRQVNLPFWGKMIQERTPKSGCRILTIRDRPFTGATLVRTEAILGADVSRYKMMEDYFLMRHLQKNGFVWIEAFVPFTNLQASNQNYGNLLSRVDENDGAAMRMYGIKSPLVFLEEQIKYSIRDLYYAIKQGRLEYVFYVFKYHRSLIRGYLRPRQYIS